MTSVIRLDYYKTWYICGIKDTFAKRQIGAKDILRMELLNSSLFACLLWYEGKLVTSFRLFFISHFRSLWLNLQEYLEWEERQKIM